MSKTNLTERLSQGVFLLDGAMGTQLAARGVSAGTCNESVNLDSPDIVEAIHRAYYGAGSDAVLTNTFGANAVTLSRHGYGDQVEKINTAAARIARKAAGDTQYVLGDIGPSGDFLEPVGPLMPYVLKDAFDRQVSGLIDGGVDGLIIETMTALDELEIAVESAKRKAGRLPIFVSMSFDEAGDDFRTMMGVSVEAALEKMLSFEVAAIGFNCGRASMEDYIRLAKRYTEAVGDRSLPLIFSEPNAGMPELVDGEAVYQVTPQKFAEEVNRIHELGINILGGCCGTAPDYIEAVAKRLKSA